MFRRVTGFVTMLCAFLMILVGLLPWAPAVYASEFKVLADSSGVRIVTGEPLFGMNNMAPGDTFGFDLEVVNDREDAFFLAISSDVDGDSNSLFENFEIKISKLGIVKYKGLLSELQDFNLGAFPAGAENTFQMEILLPTSAGNDCQGLSVNVRFQLMLGSPGSPGGGDPVTPPDGDEDPGGPIPPVNPGGDDDDDSSHNPGDGTGDVAPEEPNPWEPVLPVTGTSINLFVTLGLLLFLLGLLLLRSADKEKHKFF